jgi:hypothetical protein
MNLLVYGLELVQRRKMMDCENKQLACDIQIDAKQTFGA